MIHVSIKSKICVYFIFNLILKIRNYKIKDSELPGIITINCVELILNNFSENKKHPANLKDRNFVLKDKKDTQI